jgi:hypothetical protein
LARVILQGRGGLTNEVESKNQIQKPRSDLQRSMVHFLEIMGAVGIDNPNKWSDLHNLIHLERETA